MWSMEHKSMPQILWKHIGPTWNNNIIKDLKLGDQTTELIPEMVG